MAIARSSGLMVLKAMRSVVRTREAALLTMRVTKII
jgi:hypothetical protein